MRVLIVDDSRAMRSIVGRLIKELGFEVLEAANGREALAQLKNTWGVELSLVDWNMPEMNGLEFVQAVRAEPEYDAMKVMMITTATDLGHVTSALEAGANEYLMKPFTKDSLLMKLQTLGIAGA